MTECFEAIETLSPDLQKMMIVCLRAKTRIEVNASTRHGLIAVSAFVLGLTIPLASVLPVLAWFSNLMPLWSLACSSGAVMVLALTLLVGFYRSQECWFIPSRVWWGKEVYPAVVVWADTRAAPLVALHKRIVDWNDRIAYFNELVACQNSGSELSEEEDATLRRAEQEYHSLETKIEELDYLCSLGYLGEFRERARPAGVSPPQKPTDVVMFQPDEFREALAEHGIVKED